MNRYIRFSLLLIGVLLLESCTKVPLTNRRQMNLLPESMLLSMSLTNYNDYLKQNAPIPIKDQQARKVKDIGGKISSAVENFLKEHKQDKRIKDFAWEFNLVKDDTPNAWCMPGGKVVVNSGILPIAKDDEGIACIMGHEIAHAVARHGNERLSQQLLITFGAIGLDVALKEKPKETKELFMLAYGAGSTLGSLAYSRNHETEADRLGLIFMAMAGYNPAKAVDFWKRMEQAGSSNVPEFLSTHPSHGTRIKDLEKHLAEANKYYKK